MTPAELAAGLAAGSLIAGTVAVRAGLERTSVAERIPIRRRRPPRPGAPGDRRRTALGLVAGMVTWALTGWPAAGVAVVAATVWMPWLLGAAGVVRRRIETLEALERWCRRMADTLAGGGAIGLAQVVVSTSGRVDEPIAKPVAALARRIQLGSVSTPDALRAFADEIDDRSGDAVAAALLLALDQQSAGVAAVLRQLADSIARDVRARRDIEAARAESRQSVKMLLVIQAGLLVLLALVPGVSAPYSTPTGQLVMLILLCGTAGLLTWMRRLSLGRPAPRFMGTIGGPR